MIQSTKYARLKPSEQDWLNMAVVAAKLRAATNPTSYKNTCGTTITLERITPPSKGCSMSGSRIPNAEMMLIAATILKIEL
jgi:hypothetical protein